MPCRREVHLGEHRQEWLEVSWETLGLQEVPEADVMVTDQ